MRIVVGSKRLERSSRCRVGIQHSNGQRFDGFYGDVAGDNRGKQLTRLLANQYETSLFARNRLFCFR